ncbi:MAG: YdcF family protein [Anaerolineae bacterium]|nr:YdcF family protein [Anaerolineae bacterium]
MWKRLKPITRLFLIMIGVWMLISVGLALRAHHFGQQREDQTADVIIVLGSGLRRDGSAGDALYRRTLWAAEAWQADRAPAILCTGGRSEQQRHSEASVCREILIENGVPETAIYLEDQSRSTEENAINSKAILQANGWQQALLITDAFHMLRASWIFEDQAIAHYSYPVPSQRVRWHWYSYLLGREVIALQWQAFKEIFNLPVTHVSIG